MDVFRQRLEDEYDANVIITAPTVPYKRTLPEPLRSQVANLSSRSVVYRDRTTFVSNPTDFPDLSDIRTHLVEVQEPMVKASIIVPHGESTPVREPPISLHIR